MLWLLSNEEIEEIIDTFFLLVGLFFMFSVFVPYPLTVISEFFNVWGLVEAMNFNCFYSIILLYVLLFVFILTKKEFVKNLAIDILRFFHTIFLTMAFGLIFLVFWLFGRGLVPFIFPEHISETMFFSIFMGLFFIISYVRKRFRISILGMEEYGYDD